MSSADVEATSPRLARGRLRVVGRAWVAFPALVLVVLVVLVGLDLNGSSVAVLGTAPRLDPSLVAGTPRATRGDEALLSSPNAIGNVRRGLPRQPWIGLTPTYLPATALGVPAAHWTEAFKPQDWGLLVGPLNRGFSWRWWWQPAAGVLGLFVLLAAVTRRPWLSAGLAVVGGFTPYVAWWSLTPGLTLGYLTGATGLAVLALRARSTLPAVLLGVGSGYLAVAGFLALYPPWLVSVGWVALGVLVGVAVDARVRLLRLAVVAGSALAVLVPALLLWAHQGAAAISATAATIYPGSRTSGAGGGQFSWLLDAAANPWVAATPALVGNAVSPSGVTNHANQSETAATWLPLPVLVAVVAAVLVVLVRSRRVAAADPGDSDGPRLLWTTVGVTAATVLLLAWALVPMPSFVGKVTLLNRVPGVRTSLALGLAATLLLAIGATVLARRRASWPWLVVLGAAVAATAALGTWAGLTLPWADQYRPGVLPLLAVSLLFAVGFGLLVLRKAAPYAVVVLLVASVASWSLVNPWYRGLGPLERDPVVRAMEPYAPDARVAVYGPPELVALVTASGVQTLSGLTVYPDPDVWEQLAPDQRDMWNNYAKYSWVADATVGEHAVIHGTTSTAKTLHIDPCASSTLALHLDWALSAQPLTFSCLQLVDTIQRGSQPVYRYRVSSGR